MHPLSGQSLSALLAGMSRLAFATHKPPSAPLPACFTGQRTVSQGDGEPAT